MERTASLAMALAQATAVLVHALVLALVGASESFAFDCNHNEVADIVEIRSGASADCNANGVPDDCDLRPANVAFAKGRRLGGSAPLSSNSSFLAADFDRDGVSELAVTLGSVVQVIHEVETKDDVERVETIVLEPTALEVAEFDGNVENGPELIVQRVAGITILRHVRDQLHAIVNLPLDTRPNGVTAADFDGDGKVDLAVVDDFSLRVLVRPERGFVESDLVPAGSGPLLVESGDIDGDGAIDIVTGNRFGNVSLFVNRGDGTFSTPRNFALERPPLRMAVVDLNGDTRADIVVSSETHVEVFRANRASGFERSASRSAATTASWWRGCG